MAWAWQERSVWRRLWRQLTPRRHRQLLLASGLMLLSGGLEMLSLAAVVPLLVALMQWSEESSRSGWRSVMQRPANGSSGGWNRCPARWRHRRRPHP